jgi:putative ABC transport system substrate-binding protein
MKRRAFITLLGAAAVASSVSWPLAARAQQGHIRVIGSLHILAEDDPESRLRHAAFKQGLKELGWIDGGNARIEARWAGGDDGRLRKLAAELVALAPDVIVTSGSVTVRPLQQATRSAALASEASSQRGDSKVRAHSASEDARDRAGDTRPEPGSSARVPIVFVQVVDPVGSGYVDSLARPGGNTTGFTQFEYSLSGKWVELLKQIAPGVTRAAVIRDPTRGPGVAQFAAIQTAAQSLGVELTPVNALDVRDIERGLTTFAHAALASGASSQRGESIVNGGLIVTSGGTGFHRDVFIPLAARLRLPAVYPYRYYATEGGLASYGPSTIDQFRRAAGYVDRILKGEKPGDLPVQAPTKYELVINLKTAKALGLAVPDTVLARADEVIE